MRLQRQRAQSLLEFALLVPFFLLLIFGLVDFSRLLFTYISLANGTRELARVAALPSTTSATPAAPVNAFNNLTLFNGPVASAASQITFRNTAGNSISCNIVASGCTLTLTTTGSGPYTTTLRTSLGAAVSYTFTSTPDPGAFLITGNGDYVIASALGSDFNGSVRICPLPITSTCTVGAPGTASDGFIDVRVSYDFPFNPLFENRLAGVVTTSFMTPFSRLQTSTRTYVE